MLFRDLQGRPRALEDRCPHRGVPLSVGTCRGGRLICKYHGWEFDGDGVCRLIPSSVTPTIPRPMARCFPVRECGKYLEVQVEEKSKAITTTAPLQTMKRRARWATPADNRALVDLVRACPMRGDIELYFDRAPDFFALSRLQGAGANVCVVDDLLPGRLAGAGAVSNFPAVFIDGQPKQAGYACDLRVNPEARGGLVVKRIYDFLTQWCLSQGWDFGFTTLMTGNEAMRPVLEGKGGVVAYRHLATMRNYAVQFMLPKWPPFGIAIRPAVAGDVPQIVSFWNRVQSGKQFAPVWTEGDFSERLAKSPGLHLENYFLAFREKHLTGLLAVWDQEAIKRMVVRGYSQKISQMRRWYNPLSRMMGLAPIPDAGMRLRYFYATQVCVETTLDAYALFVHVYNRFRSPRYSFFSTMLDVRDPCSSVMSRFITQHADIDLYLMDPTGRYGDWEPGGPCYFDPAIV